MGSNTTTFFFYAQVCVQHMKTIPCWCTFMLLLDFVIVDASVANMYPRVNCLKSKVQYQSYLLCNLVYRGLSAKVIPTNIPTHRYQSSRPPYLTVFVFLVHLKKKKGENSREGNRRRHYLKLSPEHHSTSKCGLTFSWDTIWQATSVTGGRDTPQATPTHLPYLIGSPLSSTNQPPL